MPVIGSGTQAVDRATSLLVDILESGKPEMLSELASKHDIPKSTTSRLLGALERQGLISRNNNGLFLPGSILTRFARSQNQDSVVVARFHPILESLSEKTGESTNLAIISNGELKMIDQVNGQYLLGATNWIGKSVPLHCSALGKVFLAYGSASISNRDLEKRTSKTITNKNKLLIDLETVRRRGFATINNELEIGLIAIAAPIRDFDGSVIGAVSVSGSSTRLRAKDLPKIGQLIINEISSFLTNKNQNGKVGAA